MVSPPRFELTAKPGETQRQVVEIMNADVQPATYRMRTADWTLDDKARGASSPTRWPKAAAGRGWRSSAATSPSARAAAIATASR